MIQILNLFRKFIRKNSKSTLENHSEQEESKIFIWCLVGNIIEKHFFGDEREIRFGTKHFSPGAKVYCFPVLWGDGYEKIKVIGQHRKSKRLITIITDSKYITNWRLQSVYSTTVIKMMFENQGWTNKEADKERILEMLKWVPQRTELID